MIAMPNKADAPNQAMTIWLESKHLWHACWTPSARSASSRALEMSVVVSVTFTFDGTEKVFRDSTMHRRYRFRHRRLFQRHDRCVIEFMISDFGTFKQQVAIKSAELGMDLVALDYLFDDRKA